MIVSHRHRFIFVRTRATAGTAIEIALSRCCGDTDIITRRAGPAVGRGAQNDTLPLRNYRAHDGLQLLRARRARLRSHAAAAEVRAVIGIDLWDSYFKFCVERDPWDKALALYNRRTLLREPRPSLMQFLGSLTPDSLSNFDIYTIDGALAVDRVIRFEHLADELEALRHLLDLPEPWVLQPATAAPCPVEPHYSAVFGDDERALIDAACSREIAMFGFGFRAVAPDVRGG
jgi:hypothetical protein